MERDALYQLPDSGQKTLKRGRLMHSQEKSIRLEDVPLNPDFKRRQTSGSSKRAAERYLLHEPVMTSCGKLKVKRKLLKFFKDHRDDL